MKKKISLILISAVIIIAGIFAAASGASKTGTVKASGAEISSSEENLRNARFLNMLNHNYVYDSDFDDLNNIVNNSLIALLDNRDREDEDFIPAELVKEFVRSMYGVEIADINQINEDMPKKDGYVYIIARGYSKFNHKIIGVTENEDGTFTVTSDVTVSTHENETYNCKASTVFVKNANSRFGYNIISSDIFTKSENV